MQIRTNKIEEALNIYKKSIVPAAKAQKGFCRINFLLDRKSGKAISMAIWECEDDAWANEQSRYYQEQLIKLMHLFSVPPIREGFELVTEE